MRTIHKWALDIRDEQTISINAGAKILCAAEQAGKICLWAWVNPEEEVFEDVKIFIFGTGNPIPETGHVSLAYRHLGTCVMSMAVWHVFTLIEDPWPKGLRAEEALKPRTTKE